MAHAKKSTKSARNKALAAAMRRQGLSPNGQVWAEAKALVAEGHGYNAAARLVRSTLPAKEQDEAIARKTERARKRLAKAVEKAPVTQADEEFSRALEREVTAEAEAEVTANLHRALGTTKAPVTQIPVQAQRVARGEVMRDAKGRIVSREIQQAWEELTALTREPKERVYVGDPGARIGHADLYLG